MKTILLLMTYFAFNPLFAATTIDEVGMTAVLNSISAGPPVKVRDQIFYVKFEDDAAMGEIDLRSFQKTLGGLTSQELGDLVKYAGTNVKLSPKDKFGKAQFVFKDFAPTEDFDKLESVKYVYHIRRRHREAIAYAQLPSPTDVQSMRAFLAEIKTSGGILSPNVRRSLALSEQIYSTGRDLEKKSGQRIYNISYSHEVSEGEIDKTLRKLFSLPLERLEREHKFVRRIIIFAPDQAKVDPDNWPSGDYFPSILLSSDMSPADMLKEIMENASDDALASQ